jgi:hypothetical protein
VKRLCWREAAADEQETSTSQLMCMPDRSDVCGRCRLCQYEVVTYEVEHGREARYETVPELYEESPL